MVTIKEVSSKRDWNIFFTFSKDMYKDDPHYIPALIFDERWNFNPKKNPAYEYLETICYLAYNNEQVVGRIAGLINHKLNNLKQQKTARFHRYDVVDDLEVSRKLIEAVSAWAKGKGMDTLIGPIGFSDLDKQGLLVEGFDEPGSFITLYNHPYYKDHLEQLGFVKDVDWVEYQVMVPKENDARIEKICNLAKKRHGYEVLTFKSKREAIPYAWDMFHMYNDSFANLYGFCPLSDAQIAMTIKQFLSLVTLEYIFIVVDTNKSVIGFGILVPSLSEAVRKSGGKLFPLGLLRIKKALHNHDVLDMYLIAVKPEYFGRGVNAVIMNESIKKAIANGTKYAETGPELEHNTNVQTQWKSFAARQHKRRRCYTKAI